METINERIMFLIKDLDYNKHSFAKAIGHLNGSMIQNIVGRRNSKPGFDLLSKILQTFPEIDANWLLTGIGKVYRVNKEDINIEEFRKNFDKFHDNEYVFNPDANKRIEELEKEISILKTQNERMEEHLKDTKKTIATMQKLIDVLEKNKK